MRVYISIPSWQNQQALESLKAEAEVETADRPPTQSELKEIASQYDGIIIGRNTVIDKELLEGSQLTFVGLLAKGTDNIDLEECRKRNIAVFYTPEANISSVAEHVMTLVLSLSKNLIMLDKSVREGEFNTYRLSTIDIKEKTLGVIGAGPIAQEVMKRARTFGMDILCYTPHPERHQDIGVRCVTQQYLLQESDFVSVNLPLTEDTRYLLDTDELDMMKDSAFLINTSRGGIVSEDALVVALKDDSIAGAAIDVFEEEPTHNEKLFALNNVILTPHVGGVSQDALERMEEHIIRDIVAFLEDESLTYRLV